MRRLLDGLHWQMARYSRGRWLTALVILSAATLAIFDSLSEQLGGLPVPDTVLFYNGADLTAMLSAFEGEAREGYHRFRQVDLLFPVIFACTLLGLIGFAWRDRTPRWIVMLPLAVMVVDYGENTALHVAELSLPDIPAPLLWLTAAMSGAKWILIAVCVLLVPAGFLARWRRR